MKQVERLLSWEAQKAWRWMRYAIDSILAIAGVALVTGINAILISPPARVVYILLILVLASTRGLYAGILTSLLSFITFEYFFNPDLFTVDFTHPQNLIPEFVFLAVGIMTTLLASSQRRNAEQARSRERELRALYTQAQDLAALQERQRLARELHDSISQALYGISLGAHTAREALESESGQAIEPEQAIAAIEYVVTLAEAGLAEMRALIFELRPESLETEGLVAALGRQVAVLRTRYKLSVEADLGDEPKLPLERKEVLYRIAQEALHNIVKHARATAVVLGLTNQKDEMILEIHDNGKGFDPTGSFPGHLGLASMRERVAKVGGTLSIESAPGQGTDVCVRVSKHGLHS
jgi:signal transduction histidine kinase